MSTLRRSINLSLMLEYRMSRHISSKWQKTLKLKMVAEIETSKQEEWLRQHASLRSGAGSTARALPKEDFLRWAEQHL